MLRSAPCLPNNYNNSKLHLVWILVALLAHLIPKWYSLARIHLTQRYQKLPFHVTFHLAAETSVEAELTQIGFTNLGSPEPRKCQSKCILIPEPHLNASDSLIPITHLPSTLSNMPWHQGVSNSLEGYKWGGEASKPMSGMRGEIRQKLGNTK